MTDRVVVVGGGVAGLVTAHRLLRARPSLHVTVLEATARPGGRLRSVPVGGLDVEAGPDSFVARKPWAVELCRELGLTLAEPAVTGAYAWTPRGLVPLPPTALGVPADVDDLARWPGLSRGGRARALTDLVRKRRHVVADEPLGTLLRRRLGEEATEGLVAPLLAGLFAGDVDRLGVAATFPELGRWERDFGSLVRGAKAALRSARDAGPMFVRPSGGVSALVDALVGSVGAERVRVSSPAVSVESEGPGYVVRAAEEEFSASVVVLATPAFEAARLLSGSFAEPAARLAEIEYVSTAVVLLVYPEGTAERLPDATGFVVPRGRAPMTAATFLSRKWPDPAFETRAVVRCFVGAAGSEDVLDARDEDIVNAVSRHLAAVLSLPGRADASAVVRWPRSMPQYGVGHLDRVGEIEGAMPPGIVMAGNAYRGVGVADTVHGANEAAAAVLEHLAGATTPRTDRTERVR